MPVVRNVVIPPRVYVFRARLSINARPRGSALHTFQGSRAGAVKLTLNDRLP